jgi:hypothetical protein
MEKQEKNQTITKEYLQDSIVLLLIFAMGYFMCTLKNKNN